MDIERELELLIDKHKDKQVGFGEIRLDWFAEDCLKEIRRLKSEIARQSETEKVVCPDCGGSGVYQEYDEYDRYTVHSCATCDGSGEIASQSVTSEEVGRDNLLLVEIKHLVQTEDMDIWNYKNELISLLDEAMTTQPTSRSLSLSELSKMTHSIIQVRSAQTGNIINKAYSEERHAKYKDVPILWMDSTLICSPKTSNTARAQLTVYVATESTRLY